MVDVCPKCNREVPDIDSGLTCLECGYAYHLSPCSGISEATFKAKGSALRKIWRCPTCKVVKSRGDSQGAKEDSELNLAIMLASINGKLDSLMSLKETVSAIEKSIQVMSDKYDEVLKDLAEQKRETKHLKKRVETLEQIDSGGEIERLRQEVNELERRSRKQNLEIHGIPKADNEDLLAKVNEVAKKLEVPDLDLNEVAAIHRLPSRADKIPGIIVRFAHQTTRDEWLSKRQILRKSKDDAYIQENLAKQDRALLWETKEWAKTTNYRYVWYNNGHVLVRKKDRELVHVIRSVDDLEKLV